MSTKKLATQAPVMSQPRASTNLLSSPATVRVVSRPRPDDPLVRRPRVRGGCGDAGTEPPYGVVHILECVVHSTTPLVEHLDTLTDVLLLLDGESTKLSMPTDARHERVTLSSGAFERQGDGVVRILAVGK
jgi:hypothetical protein